mmetsp:Transcript_7876/g.29459  ORF Transcript_7876/g.29459 Transcript_7876/m.29459 type:complete len:262 (-) Transcript_7876:1550-2335(-)
MSSSSASPHLVALSKKSDHLLSHLIQLIHSYQSHISTAYKPSMHKLKEVQSRAVQLSVDIADNALGPLIDHEMEREISLVNSSKSSHNQNAVKWNKLLVKGIFLSVTCMMGAMWKKGIVVAFVSGVIIMMLWIWITGWWTGLNDPNSLENLMATETFDPEEQAKRIDELITSGASDEDVARELGKNRPNSQTSTSTVTHTLYLRRLNVMNNALTYMSKLEPIPENIMNDLLQAPSVEKIYRKSLQERNQREAAERTGKKND